MNNLAVALLNQGKLREVSNTPTTTPSPVSNWLTIHVYMQGIEVLENALRTSPATIVTAEPSLFNLCKSPWVISAVSCS